ncbi:MAG: universal stress protein [Actinobacteria bacterium]|nr:universal stress protein [Actinomycetota bacterium]
MARKVRGFERHLDARSLLAIGYGELGASIYLALGIVASYALGLTPAVLLVTGLLFVAVAISYAEGTAAVGDGGGAETVARRAFGDLAGFVVGWALFLGYVLVMALAALFVPHYVGVAISAPSLREGPWDIVGAVAVLAAITGIRLVRRTRVKRTAVVIALLDLAVQSLLVVLGLAVLFSGSELVDGLTLAEGQGWSDVAAAVPLALLAYTGIDTIANLAPEAREPRRDVPRTLVTASVVVVATTVLVAIVGVTALPVERERTALGTDWLEAPVAGIVTAFDGELPEPFVHGLRAVVGLTGALILLAAATTSVSGVTRLAFSMARHRLLPRELGRFERRTLVSNEAIVLVGAAAVVAVLAAGIIGHDDPLFLAGAYAFGVLLAFSVLQAAVLRLRIKEPHLERPFLARPGVRIGRSTLPLAALLGAPLSFAIWILALVTHEGARTFAPAWLALGLVVYAGVRRGRRARPPGHDLPPTAVIRKVLVPTKLGDVGEEMVATAVAIAKERGAELEALYVVAVPRAQPIDAPLPQRVEQAAVASLEEARAIGEEHDVVVGTALVRARSIGHAIVEEAVRLEADLIVLGSSPRWRRQSQFFSPTVKHVLRDAPCQVVVVAFPGGVFEEGETEPQAPG